MAAPHSFSPPESLPDPAAAKQALRAAAIARRAGHDPALGALLADHVLAAAPFPAGAAVAGFWPLPGEIDIRPLLVALAARGHTILLPVTPRPGSPLAFGRWQPGDALRPGRFGTMVPAAADPRSPDALLVPLIAFDRRGHRLGYGGGYYDRTLAALPGARAIGCAFAAQEVAEIPCGPYDVPLHAVATEAALIPCRDTEA